MSQSDPTNFFDILFRYFLLLGVAFLSLFIATPSQPISSPTEPTFRSPTIIEQVEVQVLESMPPMIQLVVTGAQPDGCELPVVVEQEREGNAVRVQIYRDVPLAMTCPMGLIPYDATIALHGGFEPGTYQIDVNGFVVEVTI
jgi:hypothetical protein